MKANKYMQLAIEEARAGVKNGDGGPFGAVIVKNGEVISRAHNEVIKTNDPTAHAEILAIRKASAKLKTFSLKGCEIYSTCEPCPMCFAAMHWAGIGRLYYGCTRDDAGNIGFDDDFIYDVLAGKAKRHWFENVNIDRNECIKVFKEWHDKDDKVCY